MSCAHCSMPIAENEQSITCQGFCANTFHRKCSGLSVEDFVCWNRNYFILWTCDACNQFMDHLRRRESLLAEREKFKPKQFCCIKTVGSVTGADCSNSKPTMQYVMDEIAVVKRQILDINKSIATGSFTITETDREYVLNSLPIMHSSPLTSTKLLHGSRLDPSANSSSSSVGIDAERFWLFFTRIKNTVTEEQMLKMVRESLNYSSCVPLVVKKLVPCWKDITSLSYISYKIGIDPVLKPSALQPSTWPKDICFRQFYDNIRVWEPIQQ